MASSFGLIRGISTISRRFYLCNRQLHSSLIGVRVGVNRDIFRRSFLTKRPFLAHPSSFSFTRCLTQPRPNDPSEFRKNWIKEREEATEQKKTGIFQRFKDAYKEYGKVLILVHCVTSAAWFGGFYYTVTTGVDVLAMLEVIGIPERILNPVKSSSVGDIAASYLLYKIVTPVRYAVTIGGTQLTVKSLRHYGFMDQVPKGDTIKELLKEGRGQIKDKIDDKRQDISKQIKDKIDDKKQGLSNKIKEGSDQIKDTLDTKRENFRNTFGRRRRRKPKQ